MAKEIERKFLVVDDSWRAAVKTATALRQAYIASSDDRSVRIRTRDDTSARLTIKIGKSALVRDEFEYDIPMADAREMMQLALGNVIEKVRYTVDVAGFVWEIDVFEGPYRGLVIAEVELASEADRPTIPKWVGREVTGDRRYSNQGLATERLKPELVHALPN
ncbi:CYTH domain-containing protein [Ciceribacter sp. L1K23]|uniref:CYTH domain-containing protein n=1 Tax=Ciceribacter sp. L1K23 TaxID=2820276 RepID=UPI001B82FEBC|nr:CYTH domain-containing protein [Ciceribacter sp. L1K23]MBR0558100.1 CYTH domain-containing protein [Ciceribacter sp. L1K23]